MSIPVLIMGESGTGKSTSLRNFEQGEIGLVNVQGKPLPFKGRLDSYQTKDFDAILHACTGAKRNAVVVDDFGYAITDYYARHSLGDERDRDQFEVYKTIAAKVYGLINGLCSDRNDDRIVYLIMHTERDNYGGLQPLTVGKLLNEKIKIVGMVTVCLISTIESGRYVFRTNGMPPAKSPLGMFDDEAIDNDLKAVDAAIREYWSLAPLAEEKEDGDGNHDA